MWNIAHNLGGFLAPIVAGTAAKMYGWKWGEPPRREGRRVTRAGGQGRALGMRVCCGTCWARLGWDGVGAHCRSGSCQGKCDGVGTDSTSRLRSCAALFLARHYSSAPWAQAAYLLHAMRARTGMFAPGIIGLTVGAFILLAVKDSPQSAGYPPVRGGGA